MAFAAVAPDGMHVAGDRIHAPGPGMSDHPVVGGAGNARYPALRRYRVAGGVGPYHVYPRANTGAACFGTSTSISDRLSRLPGPTGSFRPGVRLSAVRVEPLRCGDVFLDSPTGRRTPLWRYTARNNATARRRRYTDAQKRAAVDDYLSHGRRIVRSGRLLYSR